MNIFEDVITTMQNKINESHNKVLDETMSCDDDAGEWISDFQNSKDSRFKGDSKEKRKQKALAARYAKCEGVDESVEGEEPYIVEYDGEMTGETPFTLGDGYKYQYVWAKYPNGKRDIGVYAFAGDLVYAYNWFRKAYNIK